MRTVPILALWDLIAELEFVARRRRQSTVSTHSGVSLDEQFERELEIFRTEAETAAQFFYAFLTIHASAGADKAVFRLLNTAPLFWNTILGGLQTAAFVALGRIFDSDSTHNLARLLRLAQDNPQIFSKAALARRKQGTSATPPPWLNDYLKSAYVPEAADFRRLRGHFSKHRKTYLEKYQPLRHQVFAHRGLSNGADVSALFARTNIREMQRMLIFLMSIYDALWQLFVNGNRPVLRPRRYSVNRMLERQRPGNSVHERLVGEARRFLSAASQPARGVAEGGKTGIGRRSLG